MDSSPSSPSSSAETRTWHKQSGTQATTDGPLVLRSKETTDSTDTQETTNRPEVDNSVPEPAVKKLKSSAKANIKVKRTKPSAPTSVPASAPSPGRSLEPPKVNSKPRSKAKPSTTLAPSGIVKRQSKFVPSHHASDDIPSRRKSKTKSDPPFMIVPKLHTSGMLPPEPQKPDKPTNSLAAFREQMLGRRRRQEAFGGAGSGGRRQFVTIKPT